MQSLNLPFFIYTNSMVSLYGELLGTMQLDFSQDISYQFYPFNSFPSSGYVFLYKGGAYSLINQILYSYSLEFSCLLGNKDSSKILG